MGEPYLAEIKMFGFNFAPRGWAQCNGQILPINQNQSLYSLVGTTFGGDGRTSFGLPDIRGRIPVHLGEPSAGMPISWGQKTGEEYHYLSTAEMPNHMHALNATSAQATADNPSSAGYATVSAFSPWYETPSSQIVNMATDSVSQTGGNQPHNNMQPYLAVNFCIAMQGLFPSRN